MMYYSSYFAIA